MSAHACALTTSLPTASNDSKSPANPDHKLNSLPSDANGRWMAGRPRACLGRLKKMAARARRGCDPHWDSHSRHTLRCVLRHPPPTGPHEDAGRRQVQEMRPNWREVHDAAQPTLQDCRPASARIWAKSGQSWPTSGQTSSSRPSLVEFGPCRAKDSGRILPESRPSLVESRHAFAQVGRVRAKSGRRPANVGPFPASVCQLWPGLMAYSGRFRADVGRFRGPMLLEHLGPKFGRSRTNFGRTWPKSAAQIRPPKLGRKRSGFGRFRADSPEVGGRCLKSGHAWPECGRSRPRFGRSRPGNGASSTGAGPIYSNNLHGPRSRMLLQPRSVNVTKSGLGTIWGSDLLDALKGSIKGIEVRRQGASEICLEIGAQRSGLDES